MNKESEPPQQGQSNIDQFVDGMSDFDEQWIEYKLKLLSEQPSDQPIQVEPIGTNELTAQHPLEQPLPDNVIRFPLRTQIENQPPKNAG